MALLAFEGFDNDRFPTDWVHGGPVKSYVAGRFGNRAVKTNSPLGNGGQPSFTFQIPSLQAGGIGHAVRWGAGTNVSAAGYEHFLLRNGTTKHLGIRYNSSGKVELTNSAGTILATSAATFTFHTGAWMHWDIWYEIATTGGRCIVYFDGAKVIDFTGDTKNPASAAVITNLFSSGQNGSGNTPSWLVEWDDVYTVDPTGPAPYNFLLGDCRVEAWRPNGNGDLSQWVGSDANSVDNYLLVDDVADTADYVGSGTPGARDLYNVTNLSLTGGTVYAMQTEMLAAKSDTGAQPGNLEIVSKGALGGLRVEQTPQSSTLATSYQWVQTPIQTTDPDGNQWTEARANALQVGPGVS